MRFISLSLLFWSANGRLSDTLLSLNGLCEDSGDIMHIDWDGLVLDSSTAPHSNINLNFDHDTKTLNVEVTADFVGWSSASRGVKGYGMMYIDWDGLVLD